MSRRRLEWARPEILGDYTDKFCPTCGETKPLDQFWRYRDDRHHECKKCGMARYFSQHAHNLAIQSKTNQKQHQAMRRLVVEAYGGKCVCCGEATKEFLTIDHINDDGAEHRRRLKTKNILPWLKKNGFPKDGFRLLCANCNMARAWYGACPHGNLSDGTH